MEPAAIVLPTAPPPPRRQPLPLLAGVVPVIAGVILWLVTGSWFALCFAALGPLMLAASLLDGIRARRRDSRRDAAETEAAWQVAESEREKVHAAEHADAWRVRPDALHCLIEPPLRGTDGIDARTGVVIGCGLVPSAVRTTGGGDDVRARAFRERAGTLEDAPIVVALGTGVCVRAPEPIAAAVARALVVQLCLRFSPAQLGLTGAQARAWAVDGLPHAGRRRAGFLLRLGDGPGAADALICTRAVGEEPPDGITTVLDCTVPGAAQLRTPEGRTEVVAEALSAEQARAIAVGLCARAEDEADIPDELSLAAVLVGAPPGDPGGLRATIGRGERDDLTLDLVEDGPHAIVTGMTGTGKSELLTTWVAAIAAAHPPEQVAFVLIDFKGGTTFEPLRTLPHVVATVTDLDADQARRGVSSLSAELRRREGALAAAGVRDVADHPAMGRLVIVVDEFAALLTEHADLGAVFTDVAARGRALGMHLILGTQRASGIIRDALAANCPLRLSLRVAEPADSRFVIGVPDAAELPGGASSRGLVLARRPHDATAHAARVARCAGADLAAIAARWDGRRAQPSPWLPPLPQRLVLPPGRRGAAGAADDATAVIGLADDPEHQRQDWVAVTGRDGLALIGGPGSGKSAALAMIARQLTDAVVVPDDLEQAWDAVAELSSGRHGPVLCDDLDLLVAQYPPEYAQLFASRWEVIVRAPVVTVVTASRMSGPVARVIEALPRRALLRMSGRIEHLSAGGEPAAFDPRRVPGRAWLDERETQLCWVDAGGAVAAAPWHPALWQPAAALCAVVTPAVEATRAGLAAQHAGLRVAALEDVPATGAEGGIVVGDPEQWRAQWGLLQRARTGGELVVAAECAAELRQLAGVRELPPFARAHEGRAWAIMPGGRPRRVLVG